jgi:hypothetical protein
LSEYLGWSKASLFDGDFGAADRAAAESTDFARLHFYYAVTSRMNGKIATGCGADARALCHTDLADDNLSDFDGLAAEQLDAEALAWTIAGIFGGTPGFHM